MNVTGASLGLPTGTAGWKLLQTRTFKDFTAFAKDPGLKSDLDYLRAKLPTKLTAKAMLDDPRLEQIVLSAYGLDAQVGMGGLMQKVLNSNLADKTSLANKMTNAAYVQIARDFNFGGTATAAVAAVPSRTQVNIDGLRAGQGFGGFSGSFGGVKVQGLDLSQVTNRQDLAATLQTAFRKADGQRSDISVVVQGTSLLFTDAKGRGDARDMAFSPITGATATWVPNGSIHGVVQPSAAKVTVTGLQAGQPIGNFSGSFGGVLLTAVDTSAATTRQQMAATLQAAFRKADGDRGDISVTAYGSDLIFADSKGRGGATAFSFAQTPGGATATLSQTTLDASGVLQPAVLAKPSTAQVAVQGLGGQHLVSSFSGTFGGVTLSGVDTSAATNWADLASTLQTAFRAGDKGRADISVTSDGHNLLFTDSQGSGGAKNFTFASTTGVTATVTATSGDPVFTATKTTSTLAVAGLDANHAFGSIGGTFAGLGVAPLDTSGITTRQGLADALQAAFRQADGNRAFISVAVSGDNLVFTDISGRSGAGSFDITAAGSSGNPVASVTATMAGSQAVAASGGPKVADSSFLDSLAQKYTQAQFQKTVGDVSDSLRKALYAQQMLPKVTNWYSVIADTNLAAVVHTMLNLPDSFGAVDVDQQVNILKSKMNIADFKDPVKFTKLLNRYVAVASSTETSAVNDPSGLLQLVQPLDFTSYGNSSSDSFTGAASAAIFAITFPSG